MKKPYLLSLLLLILMITACSGKTPIQKYKANVEKRGMYDQVLMIEDQKNKLTDELSGDFIKTAQETVEELKRLNDVLIKSINEVSPGKDSGIISLHAYITDYTTNNEIAITRCFELITLYQELILTTDETKMEEIYSKMVILTREIDDYSIYADESKVAWNEGLITMDVQNVK